MLLKFFKFLKLAFTQKSEQSKNAIVEICVCIFMSLAGGFVAALISGLGQLSLAYMIFHGSAVFVGLAILSLRECYKASSGIIFDRQEISDVARRTREMMK